VNARTPHLEPVDLSVVVVAFAGGAHPRRCLAALGAQRLPGAVRLQVVLAHDDRLADEGDALRRVLPGVELVHVAGAPSPARLRAAGVAAARGRIVALTEDHCEPDLDWVAAIYAAHGPGGAAHASGDVAMANVSGEDGAWRLAGLRRAVVGGAIDKREPDDAIGWALWFTEFSRYMRPLRSGQSAEASDCNVSYAREALDQLAGAFREEFHQTEVHRALRRHGMPPWLDEGALVRQGRTVPLGAALRERFAHGRLFAALRARHMGRGRSLVMAPLALALPVVFTARVGLRVVAAGRYRLAFLRALPAFLATSAAWAAGECAGYVAGRGHG
jgi:hypothetical protein